MPFPRQTMALNWVQGAKTHRIAPSPTMYTKLEPTDGRPAVVSGLLRDGFDKERELRYAARMEGRYG